MTKLKIDLVNGLLEVEGEESFVKEIYQDYKEQLSKHSFNGVPADINGGEGKPNPAPRSSSTAKRGRTKEAVKRKESFSIIKDLDLSSKGNKKSLREFFKEKAPSAALGKNAVFVYYLQNEAKITGITIDHIYSCYKDVNERVPEALKQSILDTSSKKGWIDTASMTDIKMSTPGENFVEHDLPRSSGEKTNKKN